MIAGATRAAAAGNLYEAANSSHGNLMDLQQQQQETLQSQREVSAQHHRAAIQSTALAAVCARLTQLDPALI
jgi:hypothetical protein